MSKFRSLAVILIASLLCVPAAVFGDPPPWAPAHGWRKKHDPNYVGYEGRRWSSDYGVIRGGCDREAIGAVLGGAVGGAVGARVSNDENRPVAILVGTVIGAVIGAQITKSIDEEDRACLGHALELAEDGRPVTWDNDRTGATFVLTPLAGFTRDDRPCREFSLEVHTGGKRDQSRQRACRATDGSWQMVRG